MVVIKQSHATPAGKPSILIVEDDPAVAQTLKTLFEAEGYPIRQASTSEEALDLLSANNFPIVISDIYLDERSGLDILRRARSLNPRCAVILMTARGSFESVIEASQAGAFDYLAKPFALAPMVQAVKNAEQSLGEADHSSIDGEGQPAPGMVGNSTAMVEVYKFISRVSQTDSIVLVQGETGTGKEMVSRMIHESSPRRNSRFVVVDCGAVAANLLEAELFGVLRGAYTGADRDRTGLIESAEGGTLFLDEIGEIDPAFQLRLLRFLQEHEVRPVGSSVSRTVNVRVIAASNRDLRRLVSEKKFREDLWYRLHVTSLYLVPLRERSQDIPALVERFLATFAGRSGRRIRLSEDAMKLAMQYHWPGNVRQLQNVIERLVILHPGVVVEEPALREVLSALDPVQEANATAETLAGLEEDHIRKVLEATHGHKTRAAEILGIERKTLYRKLERMRKESS